VLSPWLGVEPTGEREGTRAAVFDTWNKVGEGKSEADGGSYELRPITATRITRVCSRREEDDLTRRDHSSVSQACKGKEVWGYPAGPTYWRM
jgi:hypothetical protein